jgi:malonyl CoA-acyl carrier protein transacylase
VAELLSIQLRSRVDWAGVVDELIRQDLGPMVEVGPGQMLGRSVRWIHRKAQVLYTETAAAFEDNVQKLKAAR